MSNKNPSEQKDEISEKEWLEQNWIHDILDEKKIQSILYFTLIWNIFERKVCKKDVSISNYRTEIVDRYFEQLDEVLVDNIFGYFKERYLDNSNSVNSVFENFKFNIVGSENFYKATVRNSILARNPSKQEKIEALLFIISRLRNNLYHGEKKTKEFYGQNDNFRQANLLLMEIIQVYKERQR